LVVTLADREITKNRLYRETAEALKAVGLEE